MSDRLFHTALTRRSALALLALSLAPVAYAAPPSLGFNELYEANRILGLRLSTRLLQLTGKTVAMKGFMAPPLKAESRFLVLTKTPVSLCPFCNSDEDWPEDIVAVYLNDLADFSQANAMIEVTGKLETGSKTDPDSGFVSLVRIVDAEYRVL